MLARPAVLSGLDDAKRLECASLLALLRGGEGTA